MKRSGSSSGAIRGVLLAIVASALWGLAPSALKTAMTRWSPEIISPIRLITAAVLFRALAGPEGHWLPRERWSWIGGVALGIDYVLYNYGVRRTTASAAGLVINVEVVATIAFAIWLLGERFTARRAVGSLVTLAGVIYVALEGASLADLFSRENVIGNVLVVLAAIAWSVFAVAQRKVPNPHNLFRLLTPIFSVAALTALPMLLVPGALKPGGGALPTLMLGALIVLCTATVYFIYARAQQLVDVSVLAIVLALIPVFAVFFAWLLLDEPVTRRIVGGGVVILAGVLVITTEREPVKAVTPDEAPILAQ